MTKRAWYGIYFEMSDLAGLIAPRKLIIAAGREDAIFPEEGTKKTLRLYKSYTSMPTLPTLALWFGVKEGIITMRIFYGKKFTKCKVKPFFSY